MPKLSNPKHESYAQLLADGGEQIPSYVAAGYSPDKGAASRLANSPKVKARIKEIHIANSIDQGHIEVAFEEFEGLADLGISIYWIATKYKELYDAAVTRNQISTAAKILENMHKMLKEEAEVKGGLYLEHSDNNSKQIELKDVTALLSEVRKLAETRAEMPQEKIINKPEEHDTLPVIPDLSFLTKRENQSD